MTKKIIGITLAILTLVCVLCSCGTASQPIGEDYPNTAIVTNLDGDLVLCEDCDGNIWSFTSDEEWNEGDFVSLIMNDLGTEENTDDEIVNVAHSGNVEGLF